MGTLFSDERKRAGAACAECHDRLRVAELDTCDRCAPTPLQVLQHLLRERGTTWQAYRAHLRVQAELGDLHAQLLLPATATMQDAVKHRHAFDRELDAALAADDAA